MRRIFINFSLEGLERVFETDIYYAYRILLHASNRPFFECFIELLQYRPAKYMYIILPGSRLGVFMAIWLQHFTHELQGQRMTLRVNHFPKKVAQLFAM